MLLEAMSYGLDVVVTDIPATRLVKLNEDDYVAVADVDALAMKIKERTDHKKDRNYDMREYTWQHVVIQVEDVYRELV